MNSTWKRLILAACLSVLCASLTFTWYFGSAQRIVSNGEAPLAQVSRVGNEVLRRPPTRLLWQQLNTGDNIYNRETIRTSEAGEITLQFKDGRYINIEPDSLFVMETSKNEISLNLLEGSLFVDAKTKSTAGQSAGPSDAKSLGLVLNSAKGKIELSGASVSLAKSESGSLDLHVTEGTAKIKNADGSEKELATGKHSSLQDNRQGSPVSLLQLEIIAPLAGHPVFTHADVNQTTAFKWTGAPTDSKVSLLIGASRKTLSERTSTSKGANSAIKTHLEAGKYWWKLVAKDATTGKLLAESTTERLEVRGRFPPTLRSPEPEALLAVEKTPAQIAFNWLTPTEAVHTRLEIFALDKPTQPLVAKVFNHEETVILPEFKAGNYTVRLSASYPEFATYVVGSPIHFSVEDKSIVPIRLVWNMPDESLNQRFAFSPELELKWSAQNRQDEIAIYHVSLSDEATPTSKAIRFETKVPTAKAAVPKAGRYIASIEAFDKSGKSLAKLEPLKMAASEIPLLEAPLLQPTSGTLPAAPDGRIELQWAAIQGAKSYEIHVTNPAGKELKQLQTNSNNAKIKNLMPGNYVVRVQTVDQYGRVGHEAIARTIKVPDTSAIKAPTLRKIKVD